MNQLSEMKLGLRPRLLAGGWFAVTACIPIIGFFAVLSRIFFVGAAPALEPGMAIIFIVIPVLMAAFFGFVFGSRILNDEIVKSGGKAVRHGIIVGVLSYAGFVVAFVVGQIANASGQVVEVLVSILYVGAIGALLVGWLIVIAGGLSGWLLFRYSFNANATPATWTDKRTAMKFNYGAAGLLVFFLFLCWLPIHFRAQREAAEESQRDLISAVWSNHPNRVREFLDSGLSVETKDVGGTPLLLTAAEHGSTRIVKILLERGANPNIRSGHHGRSPLHWACENFDVESIKELVARGADVNAADDHGHTPLMVAANTTDRDTVKFLIEHGANPNAVSRDGNTPLSLAKRDRDRAGKRDRMNETTSSSLDAGRNFGDSRDYQNPAILLRARDRHDAIIDLLKSYALK